MNRYICPYCSKMTTFSPICTVCYNALNHVSMLKERELFLKDIDRLVTKQATLGKLMKGDRNE